MALSAVPMNYILFQKENKFIHSIANHANNKDHGVHGRYFICYLKINYLLANARYCAHEHLSHDYYDHCSAYSISKSDE